MKLQKNFKHQNTCNDKSFDNPLKKEKEKSKIHT